MRLRTCKLPLEIKLAHLLLPLYPESYEDLPDYRDVVKTPMDLELMAEKLDRGEYLTSEDFLKDIELIRDNCYEYNPPSGT